MIELGREPTVVASAPEQSPRKGRGSGRDLDFIIPLALIGAIFGATQTAVVPALPAIQQDMAVSTVAATAVFSVFFITGAIASGLFGRLGDMYGKRRMINVQLSLASVGLLISAVAPSIAWMIVGRGISGASAGVLPLTFSLVRDTLPARRATSVIGSISGCAAAGGMIGMFAGGLATETIGYRSIFWCGTLLFLVISVCARLLLPESAVRVGGRIDWAGALLLTAGLAFPLWALSNVRADAWLSGKMLLLVLLGAISLAAFVLVELRSSNPLIHVKTLGEIAVRRTNLVSGLIGFSMFGTFAIFSQFVQTPPTSGFGFGVDAFQASLFLVPSAIAMVAITPVLGRWIARFGSKAMTIAACALACVGLLGTALWHSHVWLVCGWLTLLYLGLVISFGALPILIFEVVPPDQRGEASSVNLVVRTIGTGIGLQVAASVVTASETTAGTPTEQGFRNAYLLWATVAGCALLLSLSLPTGRTQRIVGAPTHSDESGIA